MVYICAREGPYALHPVSPGDRCYDCLGFVPAQVVTQVPQHFRSCCVFISQYIYLPTYLTIYLFICNQCVYEKDEINVPMALSVFRDGTVSIPALRASNTLFPHAHRQSCMTPRLKPHTSCMTLFALIIMTSAVDWALKASYIYLYIYNYA